MLFIGGEGMYIKHKPGRDSKKDEYNALLKQKAQIETAKRIGMNPDTIRKMIALYQDDVAAYKARYQ